MDIVQLVFMVFIDVTYREKMELTAFLTMSATHDSDARQEMPQKSQSSGFQGGKNLNTKKNRY